MYPIIGHKFKGRYRVEAPLGRGGMAEVYKVWDEQRSVSLALKLLRDDLAQDPVFLRRFQREANSLAKLQHPNIVRFYGLEKDDLQVFLLMEFIEGATLREQIARSGKKGLPLFRIQEILRDVCAALNYAHNQGLLHCDIKAGNILLDKTGKAYLSDFGIARMSDSATATLVGVGTPAYMAPELVRGREPSPQTDIYALGVVLYEMLTGGERPFTGEGATVTGTTAEKVRWEQINLAPTLPSKHNPDVLPEVEAVVLRCLEKDLRKRYANPLALLEAIESQSKINQPAVVLPAAAEVQPLKEASKKADAPSSALPPTKLISAEAPVLERPAPLVKEVPSNQQPNEPDEVRARNRQRNNWVAIGVITICIFACMIANGHQEAQRLQATQTAAAKATATSAYKATATAAFQATATAQTSHILNEVARLEGQADAIPLDAYTRSFDLTVDQTDNYMECQYLGDGLWNFILETSFTTPDDFTNLWDFGIVFRHSDSNNQYRLTLYPDTWTLDNWKGDSDKVDFIDSGNLDSIKPEANKTNQIRMVAANDKGYLFINNKFVTRLDLSARQSGNSIRICTGEMGASGNVIHINSVRLWELP